jgi:TolA-binding protein
LHSKNFESMAKKDNSGIEIIESADALKKEFFKAEGFLEKNSKLLTIVGGGLLAIVALYFGYNYYTQTQEKEAQTALYDAVFSFEADSLNAALKGQGGNEGLLSVADNFGSTKAGKLANLYAGIALMNQSKFKEAIERLDNFSSSDEVVQGKAYALIGDCYMETKATQDAITYYKKAVDFKPNKFATPGYMMKLATAYTEAKDNKGALDVYASIIDQYPASQEVVMAKKYKSRLEAEAGE